MTSPVTQADEQPSWCACTRLECRMRLAVSENPRTINRLGDTQPHERATINFGSSPFVRTDSVRRTPMLRKYKWIAILPLLGFLLMWTGAPAPGLAFGPQHLPFFVPEPPPLLRF